MRRRARDQGFLANPILVGALTVLVGVVAVTLAYNANNGLPFVPRYTLHVQIADSEELTHGDEVHLGGALIGVVDTITPARDSQGVPIALLNLKLNKSSGSLPVDSTFAVRLKAAIGLKYLAVTRGSSKRVFPDGATVPITQTSATVDLDQFLSMFNPPTRAGVAGSIIGYSNGFAGRGGDLNDAIGAFVPLLGDLGPVMQNLASPQTDLGGFFQGLERYTNALVPVAQTQATLFVNLDTTFSALASVAVPYLQDWISQTPPTFATVISNSPRIQSFLTDTAQLFSDLRPGTQAIPKSAPTLAAAFAAGAANLPGTVALDARTVALSKSLASFGENPAVQGGLDRLTLTASRLQPPLAFLTPAQSSCNYVTLFLRNIASTLSDRVGTGTALRFGIVAFDDVLGGQGVPSSTPYLKPSLDPQAQHGALHVNPYPNTDSPGQTPECAAGNEPFPFGHAVIGNPPGNLGLHTEPTSASSR